MHIYVRMEKVDLLICHAGDYELFFCDNLLIQVQCFPLFAVLLRYSLISLVGNANKGLVFFLQQESCLQLLI